MIKIRVHNPAIAFEYLTEGQILDEEIEPYKVKTREMERIIEESFREYGAVEMPFPLKEAQFAAARFKNHYAISIRLLARNSKKSFSKLSEVVEKSLEGTGMKFFPTTFKGTGHIYCEGKPYAQISIFDFNSFSRDISIGRHGSLPIRLTEEVNDFSENVRKLEHFSDIYLNAIYSPLIEAKVIKEIPNLILQIAAPEDDSY